MIYLDNGATTRICDTARQAMIPYLESQFGNPSASYGPGRRAHQAISEAREEIASLIGADEREIVFVSGGSEANALALYGYLGAYRRSGAHVIVSAIEHSSVLNTMKMLEKEGMKVSYVLPDEEGRISAEEIERRICPDTVMISVMLANNETGVLQPVREIAEAAHRSGCCVHCDAVAAAGHRKLDVRSLGVDLLSVSGHKFGGPKGSGFLYIKQGTKLASLICGGEQEYGLRAGTENVAAIVGMQAAFREALTELEKKQQKILSLRTELEARLKKLDAEVVINGEKAERMPGHSSVTFPGISGERLRMFLDMDEIYVSGGAACMTGSREVSHVLRAMGKTPEYAESTLRFTLSAENEREEICRVTDRIGHLITRCRI